MLDDKTVVVTGVGGGLGRECAASALRNGANVVIAARSGDTLDAIAEELDPSGQRVLAHVTDITDADSCQALADAADGAVRPRRRASSRWPPTSSCGAASTTCRFEDWRKAFETNVLGALTVLRPLATAMKDAGGGSVVLIGSQSMFKPSLPQSGYAASKGALLSTMYYLADELGPDNIRVQHGRALVDVGPQRGDVRERPGPERGPTPEPTSSARSPAASRCAA